MATNNQENGKVTILGYTEAFAVNPSVKIYKDGQRLGEIGRHGKMELDIDAPCELKFKAWWHCETRRVNPGDWVLLSFNRFWGTLNSTITDKENYQFALDKAKGDDTRNWIWSILLIAAAAIASFFLLN